MENSVVGISKKRGSPAIGCHVKKDIIGMRFGRLVVKEYVGVKNNSAAWQCLCDCGRTYVIERVYLKGGKTRSCGCLSLEKSIERMEKIKHSRRKHGAIKTTEYIIWRGMKNRCKNKSNNAFKYYGGRGIKVCERWANSFEAFLSDMGKRPSMRHSIDRINNDGNYEPGNCRWTTPDVQAKNSRPKGSGSLDRSRRGSSK